MSFASDNVLFNEKIFKEITSDLLFIGNGAFGEVFAPCVWRNKTYAIKKRTFTRDTPEVDIEKVHRAWKKWKSLDHRNLITVNEVSFDSRTLYVLMEYAAVGSLKAFLKRCTSDLSPEILKDWGTQVAAGMAYLHRQNIVHRDLKSLNSKFYALFIFSHTNIMNHNPHSSVCDLIQRQ